MDICIMKDGVERLRQQAMAARVNATDVQRADLDDLIRVCDEALTYVTRHRGGYAGGRLETGRAMPAHRRADAVRAKYPGLLS
jgi:hypothetical protein